MKKFIAALGIMTLVLGCSQIEKSNYPFEPVLPEEVGFSSQKLDSLGAFLEKAGSSSLLILVDGKLAYSWGNIDKKHTVHSIRKSLLNSVFGIYVDNGTIDLKATIKYLNIDDIEPSLTEIEKSATVADVLKSRSGIYHASAATSAGMLRGIPERGSFKPGEKYVYNNWDFNISGHILEQSTGKSLYDLFHTHIAEPLGMSFGNNISTLRNPTETTPIPDSDGFYQYEDDKSKYPAYHFRLSARDLALYGQLYLNEGKWNGKQIISKEWIERSTTPYSIKNERYGIGYGMLWNVLYPTETRKSKSFYHTGLGVHMLGVYPASKLVLIHRVDTEKEFRFSEGDYYKMISMVWGAQMSE
ncbi:MAG: amide hydrolase [Flavobacteriaceae bacterium]|nr:amide hydrolase [Flavobacteriaceae bacterium]|tara:strand:- start:544867 stop:545937 length:1071 start_codon:yes stop_codon:yes gene_type:complete